MKVPNINTCQESRAEALKTGFEFVRLRNDITKGHWFNFDTDSMFWNTNARALNFYGYYDEADFDPCCDHAVLPPKDLPVRGRLENLKVLSVSDALWTDWPFVTDNGTDVSCEGCTGYCEDTTKEDFKKNIGASLKSLEKLQIVRVRDHPKRSPSAAIRFKESEDQYATSLKLRVLTWLHLSGLSIDVEVVDLVE
jgi:hypothetical protein